MKQGNFYDVVIVGAGPAGLSVGCELSKELSVLVIEKDKVGETTKSWVVPLDIAYKNEDVKQFTFSGVTRWSTNTFTGAKISWNAKLFEKYPYIREKDILNYWAGVIRDNQSTTMDDCGYKDHYIENDLVTVRTSKGDFTCKLLIDASGSDSLVVNKYEIERDYYWWAVYGCIVEHPNGLPEDMTVGEYRFWQTFKDTNVDPEASLRKGRPVFEYEVFDEKTSFPLILFLEKTKVPVDFMKQEFLRILREEESTRSFRDVTIKEHKYGYFPSGGLSQQISEDRVAFIGDAGCWTTPCGWGMTFILNNYKHYAENLITLVKQDKLDKDSLNSLVDFKDYDQHQIVFDKLIIHFLANATALQLDRFINFFTVIDPLISEKMFTLRITREEIVDVLKLFLKHFELEELMQIIPREDYLLIVEIAKEFLEDLVLEKVFHRHHESDSGFAFK